jgi:hypothetical protein
VVFERLPHILQINGKVAQKKINHQAVNGENLKSRTEIGKNNGRDHGGDDHNNQEKIIESKRCLHGSGIPDSAYLINIFHICNLTSFTARMILPYLKKRLYKINS